MVKKKSIFPLTKLSDVISMKSGESITAERITSKGKFPCFGGNGLRGYTTTFTHDGSYTLVGRQGALCGNVTFVSGRFYASEHAIVVTPKKETDIKFMSYVLYDMNLNQYSESSAQPGLSVKKLLELEYPIPQNKEEQTAIAEALSDIDSLIFSLQKLIEKKKATKQGAMQELLTGKKRLPEFSGEWNQFRLGEMTEIYSGGTPSTTISEYWGGSIPWMSSGELNNKKIYDVEGRITQKGMQNSSAHLIPKYCVLIGLAGQGKTRGTAAYNYISLCTNQSIAAIYPNDKKFDSRFLYYIIDSMYESLRELSSGDGGRGGLTKGLISNLEIYMSDFFLNDKYRVLKCMAARQISVNGEMIVKLSQQEIADILNFTKPKVNAIIKELKNAGYIVQYSARGKYSLTSKAKDELNTMSEMGAQA